MIRKSGRRFSKKIMLKQNDRAGWRFEDKAIPHYLIRSRRAPAMLLTREALPLDFLDFL
jgi:hypothetical protein